MTLKHLLNNFQRTLPKRREFENAQSYQLLRDLKRICTIESRFLPNVWRSLFQLAVGEKGIVLLLWRKGGIKS